MLLFNAAYLANYSYVLYCVATAVSGLYGTAQIKLDAHAYSTQIFLTCCPHQPVCVHAYKPKDNCNR